MKNNYSSIRNINKTAATIKQFFITIVLIASAGFNNAFGTVSITAPTLTINTCAPFPSAPTMLGSIIITENSIGDISNSGTLVLSAPPNFEFTNMGTYTFIGSRDIGSLAPVLTSPTTITLTINLAVGTSYLDKITISGIMVRAINGASGPANITRKISVPFMQL
ncbi:MAG: hypothetical protein K8R85_04195 [Bacteroidetes bacterium]|nr:hypothetical protein [Bacteroidota bacterium]